MKDNLFFISMYYCIYEHTSLVLKLICTTKTCPDISHRLCLYRKKFNNKVAKTQLVAFSFLNIPTFTWLWLKYCRADFRWTCFDSYIQNTQVSKFYQLNFFIFFLNLSWLRWFIEQHIGTEQKWDWTDGDSIKSY